MGLPSLAFDRRSPSGNVHLPARYYPSHSHLPSSPSSSFLIFLAGLFPHLVVPAPPVAPPVACQPKPSSRLQLPQPQSSATAQASIEPKHELQLSCSAPNSTPTFDHSLSLSSAVDLVQTVALAANCSSSLSPASVPSFSPSPTWIPSYYPSCSPCISCNSELSPKRSATPTPPPA